MSSQTLPATSAVTLLFDVVAVREDGSQRVFHERVFQEDAIRAVRLYNQIARRSKAILKPSGLPRFPRNPHSQPN